MVQYFFIIFTAWIGFDISWEWKSRITKSNSIKTSVKFQSGESRYLFWSGKNLVTSRNFRHFSPTNCFSPRSKILDSRTRMSKFNLIFFFFYTWENLSINFLSTAGSGTSSFLMISRRWFNEQKISTTDEEKRDSSELFSN